MKRDKHQRQAYAMGRASKAIDRIITATNDTAKLQAKRWATLWGKISYIR